MSRLLACEGREGSKQEPGRPNTDEQPNPDQPDSETLAASCAQRAIVHPHHRSAAERLTPRSQRFTAISCNPACQLLADVQYCQIAYVPVPVP
eukprot:COSAG01_NODE_1249_length_11069_cov_22.388332_2_plen_93_part_00